MTGTMKNKPAACCCDPCIIEHLNEETAFTSDVIRAAVHPQSPYSVWLQSEVKAAIGDTLKLFLAWDDSSPGDGLYVEFTPQDGATNGTLKLYRKDGTQLGTTLQLLCADETYWHLITACYDPDTQEFTVCFDARDSRGYIVRGQCVSATVPAGFAAGTKAGYGGTGSIRNYKFDRLWYCGASPYTEECHILGDDWDDYNPLPPRTICHTCLSNCTIVSETFAGLPDGDMPCGWDADATDWHVASEASTGNGTVMHEATLTGTGYIVTAVFSLGVLATDGDSVTVGIVGATTYSATITRISSTCYKTEWMPVELVDDYATSQPSTITLRACPTIVQGSTNVTLETVIDTNVGVTITQPTLSGHVDATLTSFSITKHKSVDSDCPDCSYQACAIGSSDLTSVECDWTLTAGDMPTGGVFATAGTITWNRTIPLDVLTEHVVVFTFTTDWAANAVVGDTITASTSGGAISVVLEVTQAPVVSPPTALRYTKTLTGEINGVSSVTIEGTAPTSITICVSNGIIAAGEVYGDLNVTPTTGEVAFGNTGGVTLTNVAATRRGTVYSTDSLAASVDCGKCGVPCDLCIDNEAPSNLLFEFAGLPQLLNTTTMYDQTSPCINSDTSAGDSTCTAEVPGIGAMEGTVETSFLIPLEIDDVGSVGCEIDGALVYVSDYVTGNTDISYSACPGDGSQTDEYILSDNISWPGEGVGIAILATAGSPHMRNWLWRFIITHNVEFAVVGSGSLKPAGIYNWVDAPGFVLQSGFYLRVILRPELTSEIATPGNPTDWIEPLEHPQVTGNASGAWLGLWALYLGESADFPIDCMSLDSDMELAAMGDPNDGWPTITGTCHVTAA